VFTILAHVLSWLFVIGLVGTVLLVIPTAAYQLLSALFQKDRPEEINPSLLSAVVFLQPVGRCAFSPIHSGIT